MDEKRFIGLKMLAGISGNAWKIGQSSSYIRTITANVSTLPPEVFDSFPINGDSSKKISTVDFALMTYDMNVDQKKSLMEMYGISPDTIANILKVADKLADAMEHPIEDELASSTATDNKSTAYDAVEVD